MGVFARHSQRLNVEAESKNETVFSVNLVNEEKKNHLIESMEQ